MIVLDASALIALLDPQDPHHDDAVTSLRRAADQPWCASTITIAETLVAPARRGRLDDALAALERVQLREIAPTTDDGPRLARLRVETGLKLPDCCVLLVALDLVMALDHSATLATYDARLASEARGRGVRVLSDGDAPP